MIMIFYILVGILMAAIAWQDFTERRITVWLFPLLAACFMSYSFYIHGKPADILFTWINLLLIVGQLVVLYYYLYIKYRTRPALFQQYFGWGDVLILLCGALIFEPLHFIFFIIFSAIASLVLAGIYALHKRRAMVEIPFAGVAALCLAILWINMELNPEGLNLFALK